MPDLVTTELSADLVRGALELEQTPTGLVPHRLPHWARVQADGQLAMTESQPSGVRLAFRTEATTVELVVMTTALAYVGAPPQPPGLFDLMVEGVLVDQQSATTGATMTVEMMTGSATVDEGQEYVLRFDGLEPGSKSVEIWLPWNERTELRALRADAPLTPAASERKVWLHHGSSISHGSVSASPTTTWVATAARGAGLDPVNLGFAGSAMLDPFVARVMRDTSADFISLKIGINLVNADAMRLRAFVPAMNGFLDTIREGHPSTPILVISPITCPIHEDTPGPSAPDMSRMGEGLLAFVATGNAAEVAVGKLTLNVIRRELESLVARRATDDPYIAYLDGRELYGPDELAEHPLPDDLHPDAETQELMGVRFAQLAFGPAGDFGFRT